jgi:hypothetical protein
MSYSNFNTFKLFENVGINSSGDYMVSMKPNDNNVSFHSSNSIDYNNVDIMSIKNIINKKQNEDLNLSSLTGTTINPVITINNNHSDCRIMTNLNVNRNVNINNNLNTEGIVSIGTNIAHYSSKVTIKQGTDFGIDLNFHKKRAQPVGALTIAKKHTVKENGLSNTNDGGGNNNCMLSLISDFGINNDATHAGGSIQFSTQSHFAGVGHAQPYAGIYGGRITDYNDNYKGELIFYTSGGNVDSYYHSNTGIGTNLNPVMTITGDKNVGIGTTNPEKTLDVRGDIKTTGQGSFGSIDSGSGSIKTTGQGSFGLNSYRNSKITVVQEASGHTAGYPLGLTLESHHPEGSITIYKESNIPATDRISNGGGSSTCLLSLISDFGDNNNTAHLGGSIIFTTGTKNSSGSHGHVRPFASIYGGRVGPHTDYSGEMIFYVAEGLNNTNLNPVMTIKGSGSGSSFSPRVGIGETSPSYPLHVVGDTVSANVSSGHQFQGSGSYVAGFSSTQQFDVIAKFGSNIWITKDYVVNSSDRRIKTNIVDVPDNLALQQLRSIPCRYYEYIDKIERGSDQTIGFIAQEVKSIIPMAVSEQKEIIPDVYKKINSTWTSVDDKFNMSSSDLSNVSDVKYRFYVSNNSDYSDEKKIELIGNSDDTFTFDVQYTNVFCYGSEVEDFHTLDKNKLFTVNFSATQEIDRIQQTHITEIASLKTENQEQQTKINTLETENQQQQTKINELTSIIDKLKTANSFEDFKNSL